jgi:hypothetical protein
MSTKTSSPERRHETFVNSNTAPSTLQVCLAVERGAYRAYDAGTL